MTKEIILKTATEEFAKYGFDAVSMNNLASTLEVNKATIYYYFKDKKTLYNDVLKNLIYLNRIDIEETVSKIMDPKEKFKEYIGLYVKRIKDHPYIVPLSLRELANAGNNIESTLAQEFEQDMIYLINIISQLKLKEKYKNLDFFTLKSMILGTISTYYSIQMSNLNLTGLSDFNKDSDKIFDYLTDFISNILLDALCKD